MKNLKNGLKVTFLWLHQLPQNIAGFVISRFAITKGSVSCQNSFPVYYLKNLKRRGVCLGDYIILDYCYCSRENRSSQLHEYGHHRQSLYLGWLYLIVVGIPSTIRCVYCSKKNKGSRWYYSGFPENWADSLGGVSREWHI